MKKVSILLTAVAAVSFLLISWSASKTTYSPAIHISGFGCGMLDGDGGGVAADRSRVVITSSGNANLKCSVSGVANSTGSAVHWDFDNTGFLCGTTVGLTEQWKETVSASGNATLTCKGRL